MGIVIFVMGAVVAVVAAILAGGLMLPREQVRSREMRLRASPDRIWTLVSDPASYPSWRSTVSSVDIEETAPLRWREFGDDGSQSFEATLIDAPHRFSMHEVTDGSTGASGRDFTIEPDGEGTRLMYTERLSVGNPIARFLYRYVLREAREVEGLARLAGWKLRD